MNEEIKEILKKTDIDAVSYGVIINYITNLQKENEQLRTEQNTYINTIKEVNKECNSLFNHLTKKDLDYKSRNENLKQELDQYKNNWEELKKWVKEDKELAGNNFEMGRCFNMFDILNKMKELEEDK